MQLKNNEHKNTIPNKLIVLMDIVDGSLSNKGNRTSISIENLHLKYTLYETFRCEFGYGDRGEFCCSIILSDEYHLTPSANGKKVSVNSDEESIIESLKIVDEYCRLRLPDKLLETFEK